MYTVRLASNAAAGYNRIIINTIYACEQHTNYGGKTGSPHILDTAIG